ncbi:MAG: hypothetical protein PHW62_06805 [Candidatus Ratteibacteria bacterium]|nr:hypothetical protein [Candidatus Ratteibacteria bacterium]
MINIFKFSRLRKKLFILFSIVCFSPLLLFCLLLLSRPFIKPIAVFLFSPLLAIGVIYFGIPYFVFSIIPGATSVGSGSPQGWALFHYAEFGPYPVGIAGWIAMIIFYFVLAFLLSWSGNLKKP